MLSRLILLSTACALGATSICASANAENAPRPNIVFFLVDDMGWQDTSVPFHTERTPLNERYHTSNMERLAADGMKFTQAYACSLCSPSRVSLMTGMNAARHRVTNWTLRKNVSPDPRHPHIEPPAWNVNGLAPPNSDVEKTYQAKTLPMYLQEAGYRTIHVGKAHFGAQGTPGEDPEKLGFDVNIAGHYAGGPGSYYAKNNFSAAFRRGDRIWDIPGLDKYHGQDVHLNEVLTVEANRAVEQAVADEKPFYLYMSHYAIHAPFEPDHRFLKKYQDAGLQGMPATWASMIESMDKSLGDIRAKLTELGVADNTIVIFMSDNGAPAAAPINRPLRGHKLSAYEGGIRAPMIVHWPGVTKAGSVCDEYLIIEDYFPTILELAEADAAEQRVDGLSFAPLLRGEQAATDNERPLFWHYPHVYNQPPFSAVRQGDWKLIYFHANLTLELYHLAEDLSETKNLVESQPEKTRALTELLAAHLRETGAQMPTDRRTGKPVPLPDKLVAGPATGSATSP